MRYSLLSGVVLGLLCSFTHDLFGAVSSEESKGWGKVACESVSQAEALTFSNEYNAGLKQKVEPKGTVSCFLPIKSWEVKTDSDRVETKSYSLNVVLVNPPPLPMCHIDYFDSLRVRRSFKATGSGQGYSELLPGLDTFDVAFSIFGPSEKSDPDNLISVGITQTPTIMWIHEMWAPHFDSEALVSKCHVELPKTNQQD